MTEKRLADIALLSIENDLSSNLSLDDVVNEFGGKDKNHTTISARFTRHDIPRPIIILDPATPLVIIIINGSVLMFSYRVVIMMGI